MHKKLVIFGGGTGLSALLSGLKDFPVDITAVITTSDNGRSTGKLREEFNMPAVGDIRKVITNLSDTNPDILKTLEYRFNTTSDLNGHAVGNLILTALYDITGSLKESIKHLSTLLDVRHTVLPISEDSNLTLMAETTNGKIVRGEEEITKCSLKIKRIFYENEPNVTKEVLESINDADLIIFSMGSLYTSLLPNIICKDVVQALSKVDTKIMYICNAMTQPGETDNFKVSDHIKIINSYLLKRKVDVVVVSNTKIDEKTILKYSREEEKDPVLIDYDGIKELGVEMIEKDLMIIENNMLRHDSIHLATAIMSYLMDVN